jgi:hypothetical protein
MIAKELRELDRWIMQHVMGWVPETRKLYGGEVNVKGFGKNTHLSLGDPYRQFTLDPPAAYSTDPAAALLVLAKCAEKCVVTVEFGATAENKMQWMVARLEMEDNDRLEVDCKCAATLPEAICKFARQLFSS